MLEAILKLAIAVQREPQDLQTCRKRSIRESVRKYEWRRDESRMRETV